MLAIPLLLLAGCPTGPIDYTENMTVGASDDQVVLQRIGNAYPAAPAAGYARLTPASGKVESISGDLSASGYLGFGASDGHWLVQNDPSTGSIFITDMDAGTSSEIPGIDLGLEPYSLLLAVDKPFFAARSESETLAIIDVQKHSTVLTIPDAGYSPPAMFDHFVLAGKAADTRNLLSAHDPVVLFDLQSGDSTTLGMTVPGDPLRISSGQAMWIEFDGSTASVRSVTLATGDIQTLYSVAVPGAYVDIDFNENGLLRIDSVFPGLLRTIDALRFYPAYGEPMDVVDYQYDRCPCDAIDPKSFGVTHPRLVGRFVVYFSPNDLEWHTFDTTSGADEVVQPFPSSAPSP